MSRRSIKMDAWKENQEEFLWCGLFTTLHRLRPLPSDNRSRSYSTIPLLIRTLGVFNKHLRYPIRTREAVNDTGSICICRLLSKIPVPVEARFEQEPQQADKQTEKKEEFLFVRFKGDRPVHIFEHLTRNRAHIPRRRVAVRLSNVGCERQHTSCDAIPFRAVGRIWCQ